MFGKIGWAGQIGCLCVLTPGVLAAQAQEARRPIFVVKVQDKAGVPFGNMQVLIVPLPNGDAKVVRTDANGLADPGVPEGRYMVTVQEPGYVSQTQAAAVVGMPTRVEVILPAPTVERTGQSMAGAVTEIGSEAKPAAATNLRTGMAPEAAAGAVEAAKGVAPQTIPPSRSIMPGQAPHMQTRLVKRTAEEQTWVIVFHKGDDALSGLTDFAIRNRIVDAHFTGIGAASSALLGWLDLGNRNYHALPVTEQCEVLSMIGDIALFGGRPVVHAHVVLGRKDGTTTGGHVWELRIDPTLEVFLTADTTPLRKTPDAASGMKLIDPAQ